MWMNRQNQVTDDDLGTRTRKQGSSLRDGFVRLGRTEPASGYRVEFLLNATTGTLGIRSLDWPMLNVWRFGYGSSGPSL